ncbi:hypothetical protein [Candidatus Sororendozoicomonas aggregata]|uniref:hypothetical protein n=1 Tax=Candidatus Sororendozoicomonas aggregata TaxID=3073239 RepID=UPI002ED5616A
MKILGVFTALSLGSLSTIATANNNYGYECRFGNELRVIEVVYLQRESPVPCEVRYIKEHSNEKLWNASYEVGYCETQAEQFVKKQQAWGWSCKKVMPSAGVSHEN